MGILLKKSSLNSHDWGPAVRLHAALPPSHVPIPFLQTLGSLQALRPTAPYFFPEAF